MARFKILTEQLLKDEHLDVIRELGRQIGVKAPTAKRKGLVIRDILAIQSGILKPVEKSKRGAPVKIKEVDISKFLEPEDTKSTYNAEPKENPVLSDFAHDEFEIDGVLETFQTYGFLRATNYDAKGDAYVSQHLLTEYNLRAGDRVVGIAQGVRERNCAPLQTIFKINGLTPDQALKIKRFDDLTAYYPDRRIKLETNGEENSLALRCIDLFAPLGFGQRGLIVAPPKTGKTTILKLIAQSIEKNYKDVKLIVLLIDERPEEVTDFKRSISGEVAFSTFDESATHHVKIAEQVIIRAKQMVERGKDVVILMDSITRLARAYNNTVDSSGKTLSGGFDPAAMQGPKRFFGAARNVENGGSLTILSTALIDTGSRMDEVIYEEFKGTGNMDVYLSQKLSEKRVFPAIDLYKSSTRKEELLLSKEELAATEKLRKILSESADATDGFLEMLKKTKNNADLIQKLDGWIKIYGK